jgi:hypothetical protein
LIFTPFFPGRTTSTSLLPFGKAFNFSKAPALEGLVVDAEAVFRAVCFSFSFTFTSCLFCSSVCSLGYGLIFFGCNSDFDFDLDFELLDDPPFREPLPLPLAFLLEDVDDDCFFLDLDD